MVGLLKDEGDSSHWEVRKTACRPATGRQTSPRHCTFEFGVAVQERVSRNHARPPRVPGHLGPHQVADIVLQQVVFVSAGAWTGLPRSWDLNLSERCLLTHPTPPLGPPSVQEGPGEDCPGGSFPPRVTVVRPQPRHTTDRAPLPPSAKGQARACRAHLPSPPWLPTSTPGRAGGLNSTSRSGSENSLEPYHPAHASARVAEPKVARAPADLAASERSPGAWTSVSLSQNAGGSGAAGLTQAPCCQVPYSAGG